MKRILALNGRKQLIKGSIKLKSKREKRKRIIQERLDKNDETKVLE